MILFDILYNITIYPIEFIIEIVFYLFNNVFKSGYATSLFFLSLIINFISLPLYNIAESWKAKERAIQEKMKPMIDNIKAVYKGDQIYLLIRTCQRINGYKTIYAFRGTLGLLIQIPFFLAAYNFIHNLSGLQLGSFLFIKDFSKPDAAINIGNITINILPFVMTLFSLLSGLVYSKKLKFKESLPLYIVSLIFLILLYNSPSGLVFYWTLNCLFSLIKNIFIEYKLYKVFVVNKNKILRGYNIFFVILTIIFILLLSLGNIEKKGYLSDFSFERFEEENISYHFKLFYYSKIFKHNDIYRVKVDTNKLNNDSIIDIKFDDNGSPYGNIILKDYIENIGKIEVYYKLFIKKYIINILIILFILFILFNSYKYVLKIISNNFVEKRNLLIVSSCLVISVLSGLFISSSLIGNSPTEFKNPFDLIINDFSMSLGLFLFYPLFIYVLFSEKIKNYLTLLLIFLASFVLVNTFIMKGNYININADFVFDNTDLLKASFKEILLTIILTVILISIIILILKNNKAIFLINIYSIVLLVLISISIFDISKIIKEHNKLKNIQVDNKSSDIKIFNMSKTGENIFVFVLDRAINSYWLDAFERFTNYKKDFDGFIFYPNNVSFSDFTATAASLYGGYDYLPYEISTNGSYDIKRQHNNALLTIPKSLQKYNYKNFIVNPPYVNFSSLLWRDLGIYSNMNATHIDKNITKYALYKTFGITEMDNMIYKKLIRFSIFKMIPMFLRYNFYDDGKWFIDKNKYSVSHSMQEYALLSSITNFISIECEGNYYNTYHNNITHLPNEFNDDFYPSSADNLKDENYKYYEDIFTDRNYYANVASIKLLIDFIKFLKENNIYDNTKIIVVADHGVYVNYGHFFGNYGLKIGFNPLLAFKDLYTQGNIKIDSNFMTIADAPFLATKHIPNIKNPFNNKLITNDYKTNGAYMIDLVSWKVDDQFSNAYNFNKYYYVKDNIFDINNWKKFQINWKTKETEEIELK